MAPQDREGAVSAVVAVLRKATRIVQLTPFAYLCFYATYMLFGVFASEELLCFVDSLFTITPYSVVGMLVLSRLFRLCVWHKAACLIPTLSQAEGYIDSFVITFTQEEIIAINITLGLLTVAFLFLAARHFTHGLKRDTE